MNRKILCWLLWGLTVWGLVGCGVSAGNMRDCEAEANSERLPAGAAAALRAECYKQVAAAAQKTSSVSASVGMSESQKATAIRQVTLDVVQFEYDRQTVAAGDARETALWDEATSVARASTNATANAVGTARADDNKTKTREAEETAAASATRFWDGETATLTAKWNAEGTETAVPKTATAEAIAMLRAVQDAKDEEARREQARYWEGFKGAAWAIGGALLPIAIFIVVVVLFGLGVYWLVLKIRNWDLKERTLKDKEEMPVGMLIPAMGLPFMSGQQPATIRLLTPPTDYVPAVSAAANGNGNEIEEGEVVGEEVLGLVERDLDLDEQPTPWHIPIGDTGKARKDWISLKQPVHLLVGGAPGMRKSTQVHGFIQALIYGGAVDLYLCDGKNGSEFGGYRGEPHVEVVADRDVLDALERLHGEMVRRQVLGVQELDEWNKGKPAWERLRRSVVVFDEFFTVLAEDGGEELLIDLILRGRSTGLHFILATQLPDGTMVPRQIRTNVLTRIAFAVYDKKASETILTCAGAETLPYNSGRMLFRFEGRVIEAQQFRIEKRPARAQPSTPPLPYEPEELQMLELAEQNGGWFVVTEIARALGVDDTRVTKFATKLQKKGLLTKVERDEGGRPKGRKMAKELLDQIRQIRQLAKSSKSLVKMAA